MPLDETGLTETQRRALGLSAEGLQCLPCGNWLHSDAVPAFLQLQADAQQAGFDLQIVSSYRSFERQLAIFNAKASGLRPLLDDYGKALDFNRLTKQQRLWAILRWSAIPGGSRHHFGSDIDIFDANKMPKEQVQLVPEEVAPSGPMGALHDWLDTKIANNQSHGFFRPYQHDVGAIAPERWHISYAPVAQNLEQCVQAGLLRNIYQQVESPLLTEILSHLDDIVARYVAISSQNKPSWLV